MTDEPPVPIVRQLTGAMAREGGPVLSPDGSYVAYLAAEGDHADVWVKFVEGGAAANLTAFLSVGANIAAAKTWGVPAAEIVAANSNLTHAASGKSATYGQMSAAASRQRASSSCITTGPPWPCSSSTSSPV